MKDKKINIKKKVVVEVEVMIKENIIKAGVELEKEKKKKKKIKIKKNINISHILKIKEDIKEIGVKVHPHMITVI